MRAATPAGKDELREPESFTAEARLKKAAAAIAEAANAAGKFAGTVMGDDASTLLARDMGYRMLVVGGDSPFIRNGAVQAYEKYRKMLNG